MCFNVGTCTCVLYVFGAGTFGFLAGRFGWPGDLAFGREIWLSPVIQATWEARTMEWLEVYTLLLGNGRMPGSALWASTPTNGPDLSQKSK
jgi:hypothetical protein